VIVLDQPTTGSTNPVRFTDSRGQTVAPPLPDDWPRSPVEDAEEPCPACGACAWEQVHPLDGSRGMSGGGGGFLEEPLSIFGGPPPPVDLQPTPFVVCRICGHEESNGGFVVMAVAPVAAVEDEHPEELARRVREQEEAARSARKYMEAHRRQMREALSQLDFPIYAAEGEPARLLGSGSSSGSGVSSVIVGQEASNAESGPMVRVETASRGEWPENETALARRALEHLLAGEAGAWPHRSEAGMAIWLHTRERECRRRVALATVGERQFLVEGRPEQFAFSTVTDRWAAVRCTERILITITASGVTPDSVTLRQIRDPARELFESSVD
jgi:hypothetical protein